LLLHLCFGALAAERSFPTESSTPLMNWTDSGAENFRAISSASLITTGLGVWCGPRKLCHGRFAIHCGLPRPMRSIRQCWACLLDQLVDFLLTVHCHLKNVVGKIGASLRPLLRALTRKSFSHVPGRACPCPIGKASANTVLEILRRVPILNGLYSSSFFPDVTFFFARLRVFRCKLTISTAEMAASKPLFPAFQPGAVPAPVPGFHRLVRRRCAARRFS